MKQITAQELIKEIKVFRHKQQSLLLASCNTNNSPLASYAPFVEDDQGNFHLLLSDMAAHSINLKNHHEIHKNLSIILIEDETTTRNIFARKRLVYDCSVQRYSRGEPQWPSIINSLQGKFGKTVEVLAGLSDFHLYCLSPLSGHYVRGFGQTYELKGAKQPIIEIES
jgi:putative heme iron utilization protein